VLQSPCGKVHKSKEKKYWGSKHGDLLQLGKKGDGDQGRKEVRVVGGLSLKKGYSCSDRRVVFSPNYFFNPEKCGKKGVGKFC